MPKTSEKEKLLKVIEQIALQDLMFLEFFGNDSDDDESKKEEILDIMLTMLAAVENCRYIAPFGHTIPKSSGFLKDVLPKFDEFRFKQFARCTRNQFETILDLIKDDPGFDGARCGKQFPIATQLMITLHRVGSSGEGATLAKVAALFGVGDGGTLQNITERVFTAILKLSCKYVKWPNITERKLITGITSTELLYCIGYVDGTEIKLAEKPCEDPEAYFSRKHIYSVKMQAVCDYKLQIRHVVIGYPGSVHDARIFNSSALATNPEEFFTESQWIAGDSAYRLTSTVITPFRTNATGNSIPQRNRFNKEFSKYRVRIEHCFGRLKERFQSLKEMRIQIKDENSAKKCCQWIFACVILHNIFVENGGVEDFIVECNSGDYLPDLDAQDETLSTADVNGEIKRNSLMNLMHI